MKRVKIGYCKHGIDFGIFKKRAYIQYYQPWNTTDKFGMARHFVTEIYRKAKHISLEESMRQQSLMYFNRSARVGLGLSL